MVLKARSKNTNRIYNNISKEEAIDLLDMGMYGSKDEAISASDILFDALKLDKLNRIIVERTIDIRVNKNLSDGETVVKHILDKFAETNNMRHLEDNTINRIMQTYGLGSYFKNLKYKADA